MENEDLFARIREKAAGAAPSPTTVQPKAEDPVTTGVVLPKLKPITPLSQQGDNLGLALNRASLANPAEAAQRKELGKQLGRSPDIIPNVKDAQAELFLKKRSNMDKMIEDEDCYDEETGDDKKEVRRVVVIEENG